jgi:acyl dehydratase
MMPSVDVEPPREWRDLQIGRRVELALLFTDQQMRAFADLSGDTSPIHHDADFALRAGYRQPIVYGGLMISALSRMVGMVLPGPIGVATGWRIDFHSPLYVNECALLSADIAHVSDATRVVKLRFTIASGDRLIAKGSVEAKIVV